MSAQIDRELNANQRSEAWEIGRKRVDARKKSVPNEQPRPAHGVENDLRGFDVLREMLGIEPQQVDDR